MAFVVCSVCRKEGSSYNMEHCDRCNLWVHFPCAGGSGSSPASCPSCGKKLSRVASQH
jgi:uncharacterized paraquat-inducible protein A